MNRFLTKFTVNRRAVNGPELAEEVKYREQCEKTCGEHAKNNYHVLSCPYVVNHQDSIRNFPSKE
jgi:hypothetical protein